MGTELSGPIAIKNGQATWVKETLWNTATDFHFETIYSTGVKLVPSSQSAKESALSLLDYEPGHHDVHLYRSAKQFRNFIDCVISRQQPFALIEQVDRSITSAHLGNISLRLGRDLQ